MFEGTMKNMASFIMTHADSDTMITDLGMKYQLKTARIHAWLFFLKKEGKSTAWYVELVEEDGFIVTADEDMWRGESIENVMEHSSITYRPFWLNDVESNVLQNHYVRRPRN